MIERVNWSYGGRTWTFRGTGDGLHAKDGFYFQRLDDGSVQVQHQKHYLGMKEYQVECHEVASFDPGTWASIVSSVSARGESDGRFYDALSFHQD